MKTSEFYKRAFRDTAFRRAKLEDLRYGKMVSAGLVWFCASLGAAYSLHAGLTEGRWDAGLWPLMVAALSASSYSTCASRVAALEAFESESNQSPEPTPLAVTVCACAQPAPSSVVAHL